VIFEQFYLGCLSQASYLVASDGIAAIVDPQRDVDLYLAAAKERDLAITHIIETHLHADFVSGHHELARRTGAQIYLGAGSGATFPHHAVKDGDEIAFGQCRLRFLATPGHTLESVCIVVTDLERGAKPWAVFTGDTLFIGDVGRPDLSDSHTPQELAGLLYDSLRHKLLQLPDETFVYPAHGAGSMCGRNISSDRNSTIGRERQSNYALKPMPREAFIQLLTADLPARPEYFQRDVDLNRRGAAALTDLPPLLPLPAREAARLQQAGATILDTRASMAFCSGHIPNSICIGLTGQFAAWAGAILGLDRDLILLAEDRKEAEESRQRLARVGIERVVGFIDGGFASWIGAGLPLTQTAQISADELAGDPTLAIVDVRTPIEWSAGHVAGATSAPLAQLRETIPNLDPKQTVAVYCKGGYRSTIACSLFAANGFESVLNVLGGFDSWTASHLPVTLDKAHLA
jgi:glyoxylase-like metal-dependent hydrolase (beta-lactamase superfamily II)/rhodanese-related sulfurtransferase